MSLDVTSRVGALSARLKESRDAALKGFDQFAAKSEVNDAIDSPSRSLREMLASVKMGQEKNVTPTAQLAAIPTKKQVSNLA